VLRLTNASKCHHGRQDRRPKHLIFLGLGEGRPANVAQRIKCHVSEIVALVSNQTLRADRGAALAKGEILGGQDFIEGIDADLGKGLKQYHPDMQNLIRTTTPASIDMAMIADGTPNLAQAEKNILMDHLSRHRIAYSQHSIFLALKNQPRSFL